MTKETLPMQGCYVPVQKEAQKAQDKARKKIHQQNKELWKKRFPRVGTYYPIVGEMVDWREHPDPDNPSSENEKLLQGTLCGSKLRHSREDGTHAQSQRM